VVTPDNDQNAFVKLVFGSDTGLEGIENVVKQYHVLFEACEVPKATRLRIMGGTLIKLLNTQFRKDVHPYQAGSRIFRSRVV
jgi:hypothetical protein